MRKIISNSTFLALIFLSTVSLNFALAQSRCVVNGREVPCEQVGGFLKWIFGLGLGFIGLLFIVGLLLMVFWIWMLIDVMTNDVHEKPIWVLLMILTGAFGAAIYFLAVKIHRKQVKPQV